MKDYNKNVIEAAVQLAELYTNKPDLSQQDLIRRRNDAIEDLREAVEDMKEEECRRQYIKNARKEK